MGGFKVGKFVCGDALKLRRFESDFYLVRERVGDYWGIGWGLVEVGI